MEHEKTSVSSTLISASAFAVLALGALGGAVWTGYAATIAHSDLGKYGDRADNQVGGAVAGLVLVTAGLGVVALLLFAVAGWTIRIGLVDHRKRGRSAEDSWKDMPYPKG